MQKLILQKLLNSLLVLLGVVCVVFLLFNVLPGDPARMMLGQRADISSVEAINKELGRDLPLSTQFILYVNDLSFISILDYTNTDSRIYADELKYGKIISLLDGEQYRLALKEPYLRRSYQTQERVSTILLDALPGTAILAFASLLFAAVIGIGLGVFSALRFHTLADHTTMIIGVL